MRKPRRNNSIMKKLTAFLVVVLAVECLLFTGFILLGGTVERLDQNAMDILNERTQNRKNYLENEMVQRWSHLDQIQTDTGRIVPAFLEENGLDYKDLVLECPQSVQLLTELADPLIALVRRNTVTGAFLILDGDYNGRPSVESEELFLPGLYIRDMEPTSSPSDNSDLLMERGSSELVRALNISMDINWSPAFDMSGEDDAYYEPLRAAHMEDLSSVTDMGFWSRAYTLHGDEVAIVTYSQPLLDADGKPYGVVGIELTVDYLRGLMPHSELHAGKTSGYLLAVALEDGRQGEYVAVAASGPISRRVFASDDICRFAAAPVYNSIYRLSPGTSHISDDVYGSIQSFKLYNSNTPFTGQQWVLIGLTEKSELLSFSHTVSAGVLSLALISLILGTLLSIVAGTVFTRPIRTLALTVRGIDPSRPVELPSTAIGEIDELSSAIESLSENVAETSSRLSKIIEIAGIPLAAFQLEAGAAHPYYTREFFALIGQEEPKQDLTTEQFQALLDDLARYIEEGEAGDNTILYKLPDGHVSYRWLRQQTVRGERSVLGVLLDVTGEIIEKRRIEYERDYDLLTNLLNRRSFQARLARMEARPETLKTGAMLMMDLDNLKFLNDTYGHDCGDEYIRCAADVLRGFTAFGGMASRISGDEFYLFLSGYDSAESLQQIIRYLRERMAAASILLPNGQLHKLRASVGIARYPDDSASLSELLRYADFAMYEAKNAIKGSVKNFDIRTYQRDSYLLYSLEELNRIFEERAIDYAFQPIVDCHDGSILGYEALMRPRSASLPSPLEMLRIARSQSKLLQVEQLTWFSAMEAFAALTTKTPGSLVFINSIASQALTEEDLKLFDSKYASYLSRIVVELTEGDELNADATLLKQQRIRLFHMHLAIDDFGTGYSNDSVLLNVEPDFVKVDMTIIRGIQKDMTRQVLLRSLTTMCHGMGIKVIAEGVETEEELQTVVLLDADYIQGYFTGRPSPQPGPIAPEVLEAIRAAQAGRGSCPLPVAPTQQKSTPPD